VDDEDLVLRLAKPALERYGYYRAAMSPHNSLDRGEASPRPVNLVVKNGSKILALVAFVHSVPGIRDLERDVRSGAQFINRKMPPEEVIARVGDNDLAGFVQKPFTVEKLATAVKAALGSATLGRCRVIKRD